MPIKLVCLDADDTLWHNMRHFDEAERALIALIALMEPFARAGVDRDALTAVETRNLHIYGYGAKSFTLSMIEAAIELCGDDLPMEAISGILAAGRTLLQHPVELLPGIEETLDRLADIAPLVLVTKGELLHQEVKLAASGLGDRFSSIEIVSDKKTETFERLFARFGVEPEQAVMAGDSMRSDVLPAPAAGAHAAFIPQPLSWSHEAAAHPQAHPRFRQLESLAELPGWIATLP
ncbi:HAD family hydrolase [Sphingobium aquiterrae]|uniref:HAD family hydrolase n=1 Tax=Sphingobium aquiterrae TaxID=2038656 RepID=UPI00301A0803